MSWQWLLGPQGEGLHGTIEATAIKIKTSIISVFTIKIELFKVKNRANVYHVFVNTQEKRFQSCQKDNYT